MEFPWGHAKRYNDYSSYIKNRFGQRIQKVSVNAGFTCPNRDGSKGYGGCAFCNNSTFNPNYCAPEAAIADQIDKGISFFRHKYQTQFYLAYFQAYSNTYGELDGLLAKYREALAHPLVNGLVIGTRPDCIQDELLDVLAGWGRDVYVAIELGAESTRNETLAAINRGHGWEETVDAVQRIRKVGIPVGLHMILGLPGESSRTILDHATVLSALPINYLKLHQLQIVKGSRFAVDYQRDPSRLTLYGCDEFVELVVDFLERLSPHIVMERFISQAPHDLLIAPKWGIKNFEFVHKVEKRLEERGTWQGKRYLAG
ncbi:MAG: TIGR01212 family radical SAM protein [Breznakibacter sp.]